MTTLLVQPVAAVSNRRLERIDFFFLHRIVAAYNRSARGAFPLFMFVFMRARRSLFAQAFNSTPN